MNNVRLCAVLLDLFRTAEANDMSPTEIAETVHFALEELGESESGMDPGYLIALRWLEQQRARYLERLRRHGPARRPN